MSELSTDQHPSADQLVETLEPAIEPELPIVDAHQHFFNFEQFFPIKFLEDDLAGEIERSGHNIVASVHVQGFSQYRQTGPEQLRSVGETEFVDACAERHTRSGSEVALAGAIVGAADLKLGAAVGEVLDAHLEASPTRFRGVRAGSAWDGHDGFRVPFEQVPPHVMLTPAFREGLKEVGKRGLSFETMCFHPQLIELEDLARAFPEISIVIGHIGGPLHAGPYEPFRTEVLESWRWGLRKLARLPNTVIKIGGLGIPLFGFQRPTEATSDNIASMIHDYAHYIIDEFTPDRVMFESNFPVDRQISSYGVLWNAFKKITIGFAPDERNRMFSETAKRTYRI